MISTAPGFPTQDKRQRPEGWKRRRVARWLMLGVGMLIIQILLGGITRLTGSGLSITEWQPLLGALPPMNQAAWQDAFENYQRIAQFKVLNQHFTLQDFKYIYFWEWLHRDWARLIAVVFLVGFVYFLAIRAFARDMILPFVVLFILGGLQGALGWLMVQSGLNDTNLYVSHIRLAVHFLAAMLLVAYTLWFALGLLYPPQDRMGVPRLRNAGVALLMLLTLQLCYGAFMAGLKAAQAAPTWPTINGAWIPADFHHYRERTFTTLEALNANPLVVHFIHRNLAYLLVVLLAIYGIRFGKAASRKGKAAAQKSSTLLVVLVVLQVLLGIFTVLTASGASPYHFGSFEWLALSHQAIGMCLLLCLVSNIYFTGRGSAYTAA